MAAIEDNIIGASHFLELRRPESISPGRLLWYLLPRRARSDVSTIIERHSKRKIVLVRRRECSHADQYHDRD